MAAERGDVPPLLRGIGKEIDSPVATGVIAVVKKGGAILGLAGDILANQEGIAESIRDIPKGNGLLVGIAMEHPLAPANAVAIGLGTAVNASRTANSGIADNSFVIGQRDRYSFPFNLSHGRRNEGAIGWAMENGDRRSEVGTDARSPQASARVEITVEPRCQLIIEGLMLKLRENTHDPALTIALTGWILPLKRCGKTNGDDLMSLMIQGHRQPQLAEIILAGHSTGRLPGILDSRQGQADKDSDDGNNH